MESSLFKISKLAYSDKKPGQSWMEKGLSGKLPG